MIVMIKNLNIKMWKKEFQKIWSLFKIAWDRYKYVSLDNTVGSYKESYKIDSRKSYMENNIWGQNFSRNGV